MPVIFGDAAQPVVLDAAFIQDAQLLLITAPAFIAVRSMIREARKRNPAVKVVARAAGTQQMELIRDLGVHEVVQPEFEAGLEMMRQALLHLAIKPERIQQYADSIRRKFYTPLYRDHADYRLLSQFQDAASRFELVWVRLPAQSPVVGKTIGEAGIRRQTGALLVGLMRSGVLTPNPDANTVFQADDLVAVIGLEKDRDAFKAMAEGQH